MLWMGMVALAFAGLFLVSEPGMFPGWDESVFFSQSGDIVGVDSEPSGYSPSREPGTPLLIAGLRSIGLNLEAMRIAFMAIFIAATGLGFYLMSLVLRWGAVIGFVAMVGHWISQAYSWRFFGVPIAASLLVLTVGVSVRLISQENSSRKWWWSTALAASSTGMLAMRHLEGWIAAGVVYGALLVFAWRKKDGLVRHVVLAGLATLALFSVIEVLRAVEYHGSVGGWLDAFSDQLSRVPVNEDSSLVRLLKVVASLGGGYHLWFSERMPTNSLLITVISLGLILGVIAWRLPSTHAPPRQDRRGQSMVFWMAVGLLVLYTVMFTLGRFPSYPKDRYLMWFVAGGAILLGFLLRGDFKSSQAVVLGFAALVWIVGGVAAADHDTSTFNEDGQGLRELGFAMHVLANGQPCEAASRYSAPALQLASGCRVRTISDPNDARAWLVDAPVESVRFLVYTPAEQLQDVAGWAPMVGEGGSVRLWSRDR